MNLTDQNYELFAAKFYQPVIADDTEFKEDLKRVIYIKRLLNQYSKEKNVPNRERLILNHIIVLYNVFGHFACKMLFLKIPPTHFSALKTFLTFLSVMPETVTGIGDPQRLINSSDIPVDVGIALKLSKL